MKKFSEFMTEGHGITGVMQEWYDMKDCFEDNFPTHVIDYTISSRDGAEKSGYYEFDIKDSKYIIKYSVSDRMFSIWEGKKLYDEGQKWQEYMKWMLLDYGIDATPLRKCK